MVLNRENAVVLNRENAVVLNRVFDRETMRLVTLDALDLDGLTGFDVDANISAVHSSVTLRFSLGGKNRTRILLTDDSKQFEGLVRWAHERFGASIRA